eukprot:1345915-Amorphochlora_amoeboformis.AAC.1
MDECLSNKKLQEVDFEDVYVARGLCHGAEAGYSHSGDMKKITLSTFITSPPNEISCNDDLSHQMAINPDGVFNVKRDPGYTAPANNPMIPAALEHKQEAG